MSRITPETCVPAAIVGRFAKGVKSALGETGGKALFHEMALDAGTIRPFFPEDRRHPEWIDPVDQEEAIAKLTTIGSVALYTRRWSSGNLERVVSTAKLFATSTTSLGVQVVQLPNDQHRGFSVGVELPNRRFLEVYRGTPFFGRLPDGLDTRVPLSEVVEDEAELMVPTLHKLNMALGVVHAVNEALGFPECP